MSQTPLRWGPSAQGLALTAIAVIALGAAVALRKVELLAVATPALWALLATSRDVEPTALSVVGGRPELRAVEGSRVDVQLRVLLAEDVAYIRAELALPSAFEDGVEGAARGAAHLDLTGHPLVRRWGRHRLGPLRVDLLSTGGLRSASVDVPLSLEVLAVPLALPVGSASAPRLLPNRLGEHVTRAAGHGVEPIGVRQFAAGDPVRRVNWRVSSRRQSLHVTVAAAERAVELVLVVDALSDVGAPPDSSLDRSVRTVTGMAQRWLRERDTVGLLVLGGALRWLTPANGRVQQQRIAESVLWAWSPPGEVPPEVDRVPRAVLPDGAVVVVVSPLLEERALLAVDALRKRSSRLLVVDVLGTAAPAVARKDQVGQLAARLWRLDREAVVERYRRLGVPVLQPHDGELDRLVALALRTLR